MYFRTSFTVPSLKHLAARFLHHREGTRLVSQARPTSAREGNVWCTAYTNLVPAHCTVHPNHVAVFCHMMHSIIVSVAIAISKTAKESQDIFPATTETVKNTSRIVFRERAYPATGNSRVHYLKSGYVVKLIAFQWDKACIRSSPDPFLSCESRSGLRD